MKSSTATRITAWIEADLLAALTEKTRAAGVSKDRLIGGSLSTELDYLETLPPNSERVAGFLRALGRANKGKARFNLTLTQEVALRMDTLCEEKGVTRDQFLSEYVRFLVEGDPAGSCVSPLDMAYRLLVDPRFDYTDEHEHPYDALSLSDEVIDLIPGILKEGVDVERQ